MDAPAPALRPPLPMSRGLLLASLVGLAATVLLSGWASGLAGSTETRYAEIAREMLARGDFVVPTLNGAPHLEKPPFAYWALMASYAVLGVGDVAARVPGLLAAAATLAAVAAAARRLAPAGADARATGRGAAVVLATMPAYVFLARTVSTDVWLVACTTVAGAGVAVSAATDGRPGLRWTLAMHAALGVGMLVKGPAVLLTPIVGAVAAAVAARRVRVLRPLVHPVGLLVSLATAASWYVAGDARLPGLLDLYLTRRVTGGVLSGEHHDNPWWVVWGPVLLGSAPWVGALFGAVPTLRRRGGLAPLAAMALAAPVFFTLVPSRLPTYGLPSLPWVALMVTLGAPRDDADGERGDRAWRTHLRRATEATAAVAALGAVVLLVVRATEGRWPAAVATAALVAVALVGAALAVAARRRAAPEGARLAAAAALAVVAAGAVALAVVPEAVGGHRRLVERALSLRSAGEELGVAVHKDGDWALLPFYAASEARFFGYGERLALRPPTEDAPGNFVELDALGLWFRAPQRRWLMLRTVVKDPRRDPWRRLGDGPVVVVTRDDLYTVVTNRPLE